MSIASTPNLMYTSQDESKHSSMMQVSLKDKQVTSKSLTPLPTSGAAAKGVHFCPVVSEVSWRDSFSDEEEPQDDRDEDDTDEEMERALVALEQGEDVMCAPRKHNLMLQKIQIGVPVGPGSSERERVVMDLGPVTPTSTESHVVSEPVTVQANKTSSPAAPMETTRGNAKKSGRFGGFFQRFSLRRLSGRVVGGNNGSSKKQKEDKKKVEVKVGKKQEAEYEDVTIIPLHPPPSEDNNKPVPDVVVSSKPPLPPLPPRSVGGVNKRTPSPRRRPDADEPAPPNSVSGLQQLEDSTTMSHIDPRAAGRRPPLGLLETDLDTDVSTVRPHQDAAPGNKKARSLLNLQQRPAMLLQPPPGGSNRPITPADSRAKSMEFLLDKENQAAVQVGSADISTPPPLIIYLVSEVELQLLS
ncbi:hypothetical protein L9F63_016798 [Diploptera punctata]|uniref:Uncharacterized protein n=1 Tax=Diploptera punctata TaxID=6984 RepID=A0AAD8A272_DIPPU|nr:hypothetical protein L9F63_016798 [Diploptera punctata]